MTYQQWKEAVAAELPKHFDMTVEEARQLIATREQCWRELFRDDYTPEQAAQEEATAAEWCEAC